MKCYQPVLIKHRAKAGQLTKKGEQKYSGNVLVPCGRCLACKEAKAREYTTRFIKEATYYKYKIFATLTYDNENITKDYGLDKKEIVKYLKRVQKTAKKNKIEYKYYLTGEYGDLESRPHYHIAIVSDNKKIADIFKEKWNKGITEFEECDVKAIHYVIGYVDKKVLGYDNYGKREAPFRKFSRGLGLKWLIDNKEQVAKEKHTWSKGYKVGLPKYYKNKLEEMNMWSKEEEKERAILQNEKLTKYYEDKYGDITKDTLVKIEGKYRIVKELDKELTEIEEKVLQQRKIEYEQKAQLFKKRRGQL